MLLRSGDSASAISELEEAVDLITMGEGPASDNAPKQFWRLLLRLGQLHHTKGNSTKGRFLVQHATRLATLHESPLGVARSLATMAGILEALGESDKAQDCRQRAIDGMRQLGDRRSTAELLLSGKRIGRASSQSEINDSYAQAHEARKLAEEVGWDEGVRQAQANPGLR